MLELDRALFLRGRFLASIITVVSILYFALRSLNGDMPVLHCLGILIAILLFKAYRFAKYLLLAYFIIYEFYFLFLAASFFSAETGSLDMKLQIVTAAIMAAVFLGFSLLLLKNSSLSYYLTMCRFKPLESDIPEQPDDASDDASWLMSEKASSDTNVKNVMFASVIAVAVVLMLFVLVFSVNEIAYVDQAGKTSAENDSFRIRYLLQKNVAHWMYPDTGRDSLMMVIEGKFETDDVKIKLIEYELLSGKSSLPVMTFSPTDTVRSNDVLTTDVSVLEKQYKGNNIPKKDMYIIVDDPGIFARILLLKYRIVVAASGKDAEIKGETLLFRTNRWKLDF